MDEVTKELTSVGAQFNNLVLTEPIPPDRHPAAVYLASLAKGSVSTQRSSLQTIAAILGVTYIDSKGRVKGDIQRLAWHRLEYQHVQYIRARLMDEFNFKTCNKILSGLRRVIRECWKLGLVPESQYRLIAEVPKVRGSADDTDASLSGRALTPDEIKTLIHTCYEDKTLAGARDMAAIALGYGCGLRRAETTALNIGDYDPHEHLLKVRSGKGNRLRTLPVEGGTRQCLERWLSVRDSTDPDAPMFIAIRKGGRFRGGARVDVRALDVLYSKRCNEAFITNSTYHDLRRSFITSLLIAGNDLSIVSKLAGHVNPRTTSLYDKRLMDARRQAISTLNVPTE